MKYLKSLLSLHLSKVFWFNLITMGLEIFSLVTNTYTVDPKIVALVIGIGNIFLRTITSKPLSKKKNLM